MSSVSISVSGQRAVTTTIGGVESTYASMPTKNDDNISINLGNCPEITMLLPKNARIERVRQEKSGSEYLRLVIPGNASLQVYSVHGEPDENGNPVGGWPHASFSVGKHIHDPYAPGGSYAVEVVEVIHERVGDLIPPTEEKS